MACKRSPLLGAFGFELHHGQRIATWTGASVVIDSLVYAFSIITRAAQHPLLPSKTVASEEIGGRVTDHVERRRHKRHENPNLLVTIDGHTYQAGNWSLGGVLLIGYDGEKNLGEAIRGEIGFAGEAERHPFEALVVRQNRDSGELAFGFAGLSDLALDLLSRHAAA